DDIRLAWRRLSLPSKLPVKIFDRNVAPAKFCPPVTHYPLKVGGWLSLFDDDQIRGLSLVIAGDPVSQPPINIGHTRGDGQ
ncbi:MAG TPA: hypothetical protein VKS99_04795, partial [Blastocatellia bacterium]|nr:hypothetical protein [Blastocatellia bacterium]